MRGLARLWIFRFVVTLSGQELSRPPFTNAKNEEDRFMKFPEDCLFSKQHEWVKVNGDTATVGITDYAQKELGDVVFVELPKVGDTFDTKNPLENLDPCRRLQESSFPVPAEVPRVMRNLVTTPNGVITNHLVKACSIK